MSDIRVGPHMQHRVVAPYRASDGEMMPGSEWDERDPDFPFYAECDGVSAIAQTEAGAIQMVERILARRGPTGDTA